MIESEGLLRSYLQLLKCLGGGASVALYLPGPRGGEGGPLLVQEGEGPFIDELSDADAAAAFYEGAESEAGGPGSARLSQLPGGKPETLLIRVPLRSISTLTPAKDKRARRGGDPELAGAPAAAWIGFRFDTRSRTLPSSLGPVRIQSDARLSDAATWSWLLVLVAALARHTQQVSTVLHDPNTGLPGRTEFQAGLQQAMAGARAAGTPLALLLIAPDQLATINERLGRDAGDGVIREIAGRLRSGLRGSDQVARYGGATFSSILLETPPVGARFVAEKLLARLTESAFMNGATPLGFSVGFAVFDPDEDSAAGPLDLIRRADQALNNARETGGNRIAAWEESIGAESAEPDRPGGLFTGNTTKDYRNMVLLWDSMTVMAAHSEFDSLASQVVERLYMTFRPERVAIFGPREDGSLRLIGGLGLERRGAEAEGDRPELEPDQHALLERAYRERRVVETRPTLKTAGEASDLAAYAIPLVAGEQAMGCLYLDGRAEALELDSSDLYFLRALAAQLAAALDRARLAEEERRRADRESRRLRAELEELRQGAGKTRLEYRSPKMEALLSTARRVAPTDATVLITGESGTGKELLARTIHELSGRSNKPLVVIDCGAIASSLIDSELFGAERGAYTGAQERRLGRLTEADGATVLLDEIGELPLEVQTKLLRFVQERQLTPVGGTRPRKVDVRVIAATNVDLAARVADGRFREDLYYRLNVVHLTLPPLRERPDDILHLAGQFLERYSTLHDKDPCALSAAAERVLRRHPWPGNVRELQNRVMQAVILSEKDELGPVELGLADASETGASETVDRPGETPSADSGDLSRADPGTECVWQRLQVALAAQIDAAVGGEVRLAVPIGRWLKDDLVLAADTVARGVARRGAILLGVPETTFRRRQGKAAAQAKAGLSPRPNTWTAVRTLLEQAVRENETIGEDLLDRTQRLLMGEVASRAGDDVRLGSALMGVTLPTYRRRLARSA